MAEQNLKATTKSDNLHNNCEHIMKKMKETSNLREDLVGQEKYFAEVDKCVSQTNVTLSPEAMCSVLDVIEECSAFFKSHSNYRDASVYLLKCQVSASKMLANIKAYVKNTLGKEAGDSDINYGKLKNVAPKIHSVMEHLWPSHESVLKNEVQAAYSDSMAMFIEMRKASTFQVFRQTLMSHVSQYNRDHCNLIRISLTSLNHCLVEEEAFIDDFFPVLLASFRYGLKVKI